MQLEPEKLSESLLHSIDNNYVKQELINLSDSLLDSAAEGIFKSDATTKLPVVGWVVAIGKGVLDIRDRLYVRKLLRVLAETGGASEEARKKYRAKLDANPDEAKRAGATMLDLIDKATDAEKASMIGKVIRAFMHEDEITTNEMTALCEMIDKAYLDDLQALARPDGVRGRAWNDVNLEGVGIKKSIRSEDVNRALETLREELKAEIPAIRNRIQLASVSKVRESGLTDRGSKLRRILREY